MSVKFCLLFISLRITPKGFFFFFVTVEERMEKTTTHHLPLRASVKAYSLEIISDIFIDFQETDIAYFAKRKCFVEVKLCSIYSKIIDLLVGKHLSDFIQSKPWHCWLCYDCLFVFNNKELSNENCFCLIHHMFDIINMSSAEIKWAVLFSKKQARVIAFNVNLLLAK